MTTDTAAAARDQYAVVLPVEPVSHVIWPGQDQGAGMVDGLGPLAAGAAPVRHQRADRLHRPIAAPGLAASPAGLSGPGGADGIAG